MTGPRRIARFNLPTTQFRRESTSSRICGLVILTNDEYAHQKERLLQEQRQLKEKLNDTEQRSDNWRERVENVFEFAAHAKDWFENGNYELKRSTAVALGSNFVLKDGILVFNAKNVWEKFSIIAPQIKRDCERLELDENGYVDAKNTEHVSVFPVWQGLGESNPRLRFWRPPSYH